MSFLQLRIRGEREKQTVQQSERGRESHFFVCKRERHREIYKERECVRVCACMYVCVRERERERERERKRDGVGEREREKERY